MIYMLRMFGVRTLFILVASRRLNSDRFYTRDFTPEVYTPVGMNWLDETVSPPSLLRHFPDLRPALWGVANPFPLWSTVGRG